MSNKISIFLPDLRSGGAERVFVTLANYFITQGYEVEFVLLNMRGEFIRQCNEKVTFLDLKCKKEKDCILPLRRYLQVAKPNILLIGMWPLTVYGTLANLLGFNSTKVVVTDHSILSKSPVARKLSKRLFMRFSIAALYPFASTRIGVSAGVCKDIAQLGFGLSSINIIHNPIPKFDCRTETINLLPSQNAPYILAVGRMKAVKDFANLIRAYSLITNKTCLKLVILGEGELKSDLENLAYSLGLSDKVIFPGFTESTYAWYNNASLFCLSSLNEGFGNVIVEAMQCGVPIVSTDCESGPREILKNGRFGKLVPVGNAEALAEAMYQSLNEQHDKEVLKRRAEDFSVEKIGQQYLDVMFPKQRK